MLVGTKYITESRKSFESVEKWILSAKEYASTGAVFSLVGNKCFEGLQREVSKEEAQMIANKNQLTYYECSAKEDKGVTDV